MKFNYHGINEFGDKVGLESLSIESAYIELQDIIEERFGTDDELEGEQWYVVFSVEND